MYSVAVFRFRAHIITGAGVGRMQSFPTLNVNLAEVPLDLPDGIYAARLHEGTLDGSIAAMHYGERPFHGLARSCELHVLDRSPTLPPEYLTIEVVKRIRDIQNFADEAALRRAIESDIAAVRFAFH